MTDAWQQEFYESGDEDERLWQAFLGERRSRAQDYNTGERRAGDHPEFENEQPSSDTSTNEYDLGASNLQENVHGLDEDDNVTTSGSEEERSRSRSPRSSDWARARAREGIRRRRFQKLWDGVRSLFTVLTTCSVAMGTWAQEVMGDPMWDAWAVMQAHHPHEETFKVDCLELFAGHANISSAFPQKQ